MGAGSSDRAHAAAPSPLKLRHADFTTITRARSLSVPVDTRAALLGIGEALMLAELPVPGGVRLLGLTLSGLTRDDGSGQPTLPL